MEHRLKGRGLKVEGRKGRRGACGKLAFGLTPSLGIFSMHVRDDSGFFVSVSLRKMSHVVKSVATTTFGSWASY